MTSKLEVPELPEISYEQNNVINFLQKGNNVIVDSVAGSGKTTCSLYIAKTFSQQNILLLTYNSKLKTETREKVRKYEIKNMEVHSYHSFCYKYYDKNCKKDSGIEHFLFKKKIPPNNNFMYDIIILDETQDVTPLLYKVVCKIFKDNIKEDKNLVKMCIFGDENQSIFDYKSADKRFITFADQLYNFNDVVFQRCKLSESFRLTREISSFINTCMLRENRIISNKTSGKKPKYVICDVYSSTPLKEFKIIFEELRIEPKDIFILAPSLKSNKTPAITLENRIKERYGNTVPIFVPTSDDSVLDEDVIANKLVFSTFHQAKGLERKVTFVFNFDSSYFEFYKKDKNPNICPNELYVSNSRSSEILILFHHFRKNYLQFLDQNYLEIYSDFQYMKLELGTPRFYRPNNNLAVTDLVRHVPDEIIDDCISKLTITQIRTSQEVINIDLKIYQKSSTVENVSEITGIAIPAYYELKLKDQMSIFKILKTNEYESDLQKINKQYNLNEINLNNITHQHLLYISNCYNAFANKYIFKIDQISEYNWIDDDQLQECLERMKQLNISKNAEFEKHLLSSEPEIKNITLSGSVDCVDGNNIYEFKCTSHLENVHKLQLAIYMYLNKSDKTNYYLYNILTDELLKIECEQSSLQIIVDKLIQTKYMKNELLENNEFLEKMLELKSDVY